MLRCPDAGPAGAPTVYPPSRPDGRPDDDERIGAGWRIASAAAACRSAHSTDRTAPPEARGADPTTISGTVERVTFHNPDTGFCVLRLKVAGRRDLETVVGHAASVSAGEEIRAVGEWLNDLVPRPAVPRHVHAHRAAEQPRGHRAVPGIRPHPGHRAGVRAQARRDVRRPRVRGDRHRSPAGCARWTASAPAGPRRSWRHGPARRSSATSWCSSTRTASARRAPCASTRPTAPTPSRSSRRTPTAWRATSAASASSPPTPSRAGSASRRPPPSAPGPASPTRSCRRSTKASAACRARS